MLYYTISNRTFFFLLSCFHCTGQSQGNLSKHPRAGHAYSRGDLKNLTPTGVLQTNLGVASIIQRIGSAFEVGQARRKEPIKHQHYIKTKSVVATFRSKTDTNNVDNTS